MPSGQSKDAIKIDSLMRQASAALVERRYFDCERLAVDALRRSIASSEYDRLARIIMPLQEARRQIRAFAVDSGHLVEVDRELPTGPTLLPGMYLISPPRVGADGRLLREEAVRREIPVVVIAREPLTQQGLWPVVAIGPVTIRTRVRPPTHMISPEDAVKKRSPKPGKPVGRGQSSVASSRAPTPAKADLPVAVTAEWMLAASEALGDAAIAAVPTGLSALARVLALADRLEAVPDHEKLHQRLGEAAREAARIPLKKIKVRMIALPELE